MTDKEKCAASEALMDWFISQDIDQAEAADVMTITLAVIIRTCSPNRQRQAEGAGFLREQVLNILADMK